MRLSGATIVTSPLNRETLNIEQSYRATGQPCVVRCAPTINLNIVPEMIRWHMKANGLAVIRDPR